MDRLCHSRVTKNYLYNMKTIFLIAWLTLVFIACKSKKESAMFDPEKWAETKDMNYPHRDKMLDDLIKKHLLHGIKRSEVLNLLGAPNRTDSLYLFYTIAQERMGFLPLHTKTLVIKLTKDSVLEWRKIHE